MVVLLIQGLEVLLLPNFEEDLHRISVIVHSGEAGEIPLDLIPVSTEHQILEILEVEEQPGFLFKPVIKRDSVYKRYVI